MARGSRQFRAAGLAMLAAAASVVLVTVVHTLVDGDQTFPRDLRAEAAGTQPEKSPPATVVQDRPAPALTAARRSRVSPAIGRPVESRRLSSNAPRVELKPVVGIESPFTSPAAESDADEPVELPAETESEWARFATHFAHLGGQIRDYAEAHSREHAEILARTTEIIDILESYENDVNPFVPAEPRNAEFLPEPLPVDSPPSSADDVPSSKPAVPDKKPPLRAIISELDPHRYSFEMHNADIPEVLKTLGQLEGINIVVGKGVIGTISANLHDMTVPQAIDAVLESQGYASEQKDGVIYALTEAAPHPKPVVKPKSITREYRPQYVDVHELPPVIQPLLTDQVGTMSVSAAGSLDPGNSPGTRLTSHSDARGALRVTDYENVLRKVDALVAKIDVPPRQVVLDTLVVHVTLNPDMHTGVDSPLFDRIYKQMLIESTSAETGTRSFHSTPPYDGSPGGSATTAGDFGLKHGVLQGDRRTFLEALKTVGRIRLVGTRQLQVLDRQSAELSLGDRFRLELQDLSSPADSGRLSSGRRTERLLIRPSFDGNGLIRVDVQPLNTQTSVATLTRLADFDAVAEGTSVVVRDGKTLVIGGLYNQQVVESLPRAGLLSALPWLDGRKRSTRRRVIREELVVLLTPHLEERSTAALPVSSSR